MFFKIRGILIRIFQTPKTIVLGFRGRKRKEVLFFSQKFKILEFYSNPGFSWTEQILHFDQSRSQKIVDNKNI